MHPLTLQEKGTRYNKTENKPGNVSATATRTSLTLGFVLQPHTWTACVDCVFNL